ncbi:MAG: class II fructose-bisphosphate aldolase [Gemmatimonadota bacterium]|nr:class II fructose-bisphosphate aldolase [Gemmatimonadota bacterium]
MALENMKGMLEEAREQKYAVGAFNILDYISLKAVIRAAEELSSPVIVQTSVKTVKFWGYKAIVSWTKELGQDSKVPVALHLDHCQDIDIIRDCIDLGWTSVMIDASSRPFEENLALTAKVVEMAGPRGVSVEAELGEIGGVEDDIEVAEQDAFLADPEKAERFCRELALDCFAPAIGTAHGLYKGEPRIDFERLEKISGLTGIPLALHGGTGLSEEVFRKSISLGCAKINISTQLKHTLIDTFVSLHRANPTEYNPLKVFEAQYKGLKEDIIEKIKLFGSAGQTL